MSKFKKVVYALLSILGLAIFFMSAIPIGMGVIHIGVIVPMLWGISVSIYSLVSLKYPMEETPWKKDQTEEYKAEIEARRCYIENKKPKLRKSIVLGMKNQNIEEYDEAYEIENKSGLILSRETRVKIDRIVLILIAISIAIGIGVSVRMSEGYEKFEGDYKGQTLVTLGCKINGNNPSATLKKRLNKSIEFLKEYPESKVILTGGKGANEITTESSVMKEYLLEEGIDEKRIYIEEKSTSTEENLEYAKEIAKQNGISQEFIIVTDEYHEYRSNLYAKDMGIISWGYPSKSVAGVGPSYWFREMFINVYEWIF